MPVRVRYKLIATVSSTPAEDKDLGNTSFEVVSDLVEDGGSWKLKLPVGATDVPYVFDQLSTVKVLVVRTNAKDPNDTPNEIGLKLNLNSNPVIQVAPLPGANEGHFLLSTSGITGLFLTNAGSVDMEVTIVAAGDTP